MKHTLTFLLTLIISTLIYAQNSDSIPITSEKDEYTKALIKQAENWNPNEEPWINVDCHLNDLNIKIYYKQQPAHPFLAEYNRKIQFSVGNKQTDTLDMRMNTGGRTEIDIYLLKKSNEEILMLSDNHGYYFFDTVKFEYYELGEDTKSKKYTFKKYLGQINGKTYPLKFIEPIIYSSKINQSDSPIIGEWIGTDYWTNSSTLTFSKNNQATLTANGNLIGGKDFKIDGKEALLLFEIDTSKEPYWIDFIAIDRKNNIEKGRIKGILKFIGDDKADILLSFNGDRFINFSDEQKELIIKMVRKK